MSGRTRELECVIEDLKQQVRDVEKERDALRAELDALKSQEPVAWMRDQWGPDCGNYWELYRDDEMGWRDRKDWTPLYASPVPASVPEGWKLVPIEPAPEMIDAMCQATHVLNRHRALQAYHAGIGAAPEVK